jgi:uncharacterized membrane protein
MPIPFACFIFALIVFAIIIIVAAKKWGNLKLMIESITPTKLAEYFLWMILAVFLLIAGILGRYLTHFDGDLSLANGDWGTFGDYLGGTLNPILSFLSLIALLTTIVLQSKELELTRDELKRSATAQEDTKKILDKQSETLRRQKFESTFFSLLDQHNKALEYLSTYQDGPEANSNSLHNGKINHFDLLLRDMINDQRVTNLESAKESLENKNFVCGHYFRILYQLLKFVAINTPGSKISEEFEANEIQYQMLTDNEKMYSNIVRSFLGHTATQLLSINCYCKDETNTYWRYKLLIERYSFFEHMPFERHGTIIPFLVETISSYELSAFGDNKYVKQYILNNPAK